MARSGAVAEASANPWQAWEDALDQVALPREPQGEELPMPAFLQEILDSFVEFDPETFGLEVPLASAVEGPGPTAGAGARARSRRRKAA